MLDIADGAGALPCNDPEQLIEQHPCYYARAYMRELRKTHHHTEIPFALRDHLRTASSSYAVRRKKGLQQALALLSHLTPVEYRSDPNNLLDGGRTAEDGGSLPPSPTEGANFVSMALQSSFPRRDANLIFAGIAPEVAPARNLSKEVLLSWSTLTELPKTGDAGQQPSSGAMSPIPGFSAVEAPLQGDDATMAAEALHRELQRRLGLAHGVTFEEQELAMRVVQGLCTFFPDQRQHAANGPLVPVLLESLNTLHQHLVAVAEEKAASKATGSTGRSASASSGHSSGTSPARQQRSPTPTPSGFEENATRGENEENVGSSNTTKIKQLNVFLAMIDALEAACHYSPHTVTTLVNLHGVPFLMDLVGNETGVVPLELRRAILHFISWLVNQTQCLSRLQQHHMSQPRLASGGGPLGSGMRTGPPMHAAAHMQAEALRPPSTSPPAPALGSQWPNRASATKYFNSLSDWFKGFYVLKYDLCIGAPSSSAATTTAAGTPQLSATATLSATGRSSVGIVQEAAAARQQQASHEQFLQTAVSNGITAVANLFSFRGLVVPSKASKQEVQRLVQRMTRQRETAISDFYALLGKGPAPTIPVGPVAT